MNIDKALEMAECVKINLENMVKMMPALKMHPLLPLVQDQLAECIKLLDEDGYRLPSSPSTTGAG